MEKYNTLHKRKALNEYVIPYKEQTKQSKERNIFFLITSIMKSFQMTRKNMIEYLRCVVKNPLKSKEIKT